MLQVSVTETGDSPFILPEARGVRSQARGEAVVVDLGGGHLLFALLDKADSIAHAAFDPPRYRGDYGSIRTIRQLKETEGDADVPREAYPMLVTFADIEDPMTVRQVDPDNLADIFGQGVSIKGITVEMTTDAVTTGIERRLSWLDNLAAYRKVPNNPFSSNLPHEIGALRNR